VVYDDKHDGADLRILGFIIQVTTAPSIASQRRTQARSQLLRSDQFCLEQRMSVPEHDLVVLHRRSYGCACVVGEPIRFAPP
jgi:hypothetical protein